MPARREQCEFVIKPLNENVGNLIEYIKNEDKSVEKVVVYNKGNITSLSLKFPLKWRIINRWNPVFTEHTDERSCLSAIHYSRQRGSL